MAQYTDQEAERLIALHSMSPKTQKVWKTRNAIPDKFYNPGYVHREKVDTLDTVREIKQSRIASVLQSEKIVSKLIGELAGIAPNRVKDAVRGKLNLNQDEELQVTSEIQKLRVNIKNALEGEGYSYPRMKRLFAIAIDKRFAKQPLFPTVWRKLVPSGIAEGMTFDKLTRSEYEEIENALIVFLLETSI